MSVVTRSGNVAVGSSLQDQTEPLLRSEMPELDAIRGVAILGVLLYHGLYWGLDLNKIGRKTRSIMCNLILATTTKRSTLKKWPTPARINANHVRTRGYLALK